MWAKTLINEDGNGLQCNAENGGENQRAQLLFQAEKMDMVRKALLDYREVSPRLA
jgi:hypothetical protein